MYAELLSTNQESNYQTSAILYKVSQDLYAKTKYGEIKKFYDPKQQILVELNRLKVTVSHCIKPECCAEVLNMYEMTFKTKEIFDNESTCEYLTNTRKRPDKVVTDVDDCVTRVGDFKVPLGKTIENDDMIIGPVMLPCNKNTITLGDRYLIHSVDPKSTSLFTSTYFKETDPGTYVGCVFAWDLDYVSASKTKPLLLSSFYIIPIPNNGVDSQNGTQAKSVLNVITSEIEYEGHRCRQMQTSCIFDGQSIERELDNFMVDVDTDKLPNYHDKKSFSQLREDNHAYTLQEIDVQRFSGIEKLPFIHPEWKATESNLLKVHAGLLAVLAHKNLDPDEDITKLSFVHSCIVQGGSSSHLIEQMQITAMDFKDTAKNYHDMLLKGELCKDMFRPFENKSKMIDAVVKITDYVYIKLCDMFNFNEDKQPTLIQKYEQLYKILRQIVMNLALDSNKDFVSVNWFIKKCGDFFDKYSWCFVGNRISNEQNIDLTRNDISCSDGSNIRITKTFANNSMVYGVDTITNTSHYVYAGQYNGDIQWIKVPELYIPVDIFIKTYENNEDYYSLIDEVKEKIVSENYLEQLKNNQTFISIKVDIDNEFILKTTEPPIKSQFPSIERKCLIDSTMTNIENINVNCDAIDLKDHSIESRLKHTTGEKASYLSRLVIDDLRD